MREFCDAIEATYDRNGQTPAVSSTAQAELDEQPAYAERSSWERPVADTLMFGGMTLRASTDYVLSFAQLFDAEAPPVYGHAVIARAAFEAATVSAWLNEPDVGVRERIRRGLCEQLYSAREVHDLGITTDSSERVNEWVAVARCFAWTAKPNSSKINGSGRPSVSDGIVGAAGAGETSRIGDLLYCRTAAVSHVTWFGLQTGLDIAGAKIDPATRVGKVGWGTDSARVGAICFYMLRTVRAAACARADLMGWNDRDWTLAVEHQVGRERELARVTLGRL
jgi:hypothetical protein